jgi:hypothetical protein
MTLPSEVRLQILREVIPREYNIHFAGFTINDLAFEQNPCLPLLLLNHTVSAEAASLPSTGIAHFNFHADADRALQRCPRSKKRFIQQIRVSTEICFPTIYVGCPVERKGQKQEHRNRMALLIDNIASDFTGVVVVHDEGGWRPCGEVSRDAWCFFSETEIRV